MSRQLGLRHAVPTLVNALKQDGDVTALVNQNAIYPLIKTLGEFPLPSISVTKVGWQGTRTKAGIVLPPFNSTISAETLTIAVNIYSKSYDLSNEIAEAVINTLDGKSFTVNGFTLQSCELSSISENVIGSDVNVYSQSLTFIVKC